MFERQVIYNVDVMEEHRLDRFGVSGSMTIEQKKKYCVLFFFSFSTRGDEAWDARTRDVSWSGRASTFNFKFSRFSLRTRQEARGKEKKEEEEEEEKEENVREEA